MILMIAMVIFDWIPYDLRTNYWILWSPLCRNNLIGFCAVFFALCRSS